MPPIRAEAQQVTRFPTVIRIPRGSRRAAEAPQGAPNPPSERSSSAGAVPGGHDESQG